MNNKLFRSARLVLSVFALMTGVGSELYAIDGKGRYFAYGVGNAGAGAGIGAAVGFLGGALIGDQLQARQNQDAEVQRQMAAQQAEIERQQRGLNQLKAQQAR